MGSPRSIESMTSTSDMRIAASALRKLLATALIAGMPWASAMGQIVSFGGPAFDAHLDIETTEGYHTVLGYTCNAHVCNLPTSAPSPLPIPYPIATVDSTDGVLRGRMRIETNFEREGHDIQRVTLTGTVSFSVFAELSILPSAPVNVAVGGLSILRTDATGMNHGVQNVLACGPSDGCGNHTSTGSVSSGASFGTLSEAGDVVASHDFAGSQLDFVHGGRLEQTESATLSSPTTHRFGLFWRRSTELRLDPSYQAGLHYAEDDFSHTMGFTSLRFYDPAGNDVTQWINVTYDTPLAFISAPIPEPETYAMLLAGLGLLGVAARRRKRKEATTG